MEIACQQRRNLSVTTALDSDIIVGDIYTLQSHTLWKIELSKKSRALGAGRPAKPDL